MPTKTISVDLEAYERLKAARLRPDESFSRVIKRARWEPVSSTAAALLAVLDKAAPVEDAVLERLERAQREDRAPSDPWTGT